MNDIQKQSIIQDFLNYASEELAIEQLPQIRLVQDRNFAIENRSFGSYRPETRELNVYVANRNMADILRTLAHELVHHRQNELGMELDGETGSNIENQANSIAGVLLRNYGKSKEVIYERTKLTKKRI
jgi:Zn-dependent peptidase ImmA (M78 family)